jgi:8-oxo-dGTP diphosphatase
MATPRVAAGALFFDATGRVLLVKPAYKAGWDIPGGYVEPNESPRIACIREVREELSIVIEIANHLVVDWAPAPSEGDKILFIFDAGIISADEMSGIRFADGELTAWKFVEEDQLDDYLSDRLARRIRTAIAARHRGIPVYAEHGQEPFNAEERL